MQTLSAFLDKNTFLNECVIAAKRFDDGFILAKNRDRPYDPSISVVHEIRNGVEVVYLLDNDTDWSEGMNEYGICIVNSALMVGRDEAEKKVVHKAGEVHKDGSITRDALTCKSIEEVIDILSKQDGGLKGHTFVATKDKLYAIELTSKHDAKVTELHDEDLVVRTNHGIKHPTAGYQDGLSYKSSAIRKVSAQKQIAKAENPEEVLERMRKQLYKKESQLNMKRDTDKLWTSSQMLLNPNDMTAKVVVFDEKIVEAEIVNKLPDGYDNKITVTLESI